MLDNAERGLYITACALIYSHGGEIEREHLRQACRDHGLAFKRQLERLLSLGKLIENGSRITNKRAENELRMARERTENASRNGLLGNDIKRLKYAGRVNSADANHQPSTTNHQQIDSEASPLAAEPPYDPVKDIFDRGLKMLGGDTKPHRSLLGKARRDHGDEAVLAAIVACEHEMPSEPAEYLIGCLSRAGPRRNGHSKSPGDKLWEGAYRAAESYNRKHGIVEGDRGDRDATVVPLLDRR